MVVVHRRKDAAILLRFWLDLPATAPSVPTEQRVGGSRIKRRLHAEATACSKGRARPTARRPPRRLQPRVDGRAGRNCALAVAQAAATCWRPHRSQPRAGGRTSDDDSKEGRS
ncbi:hypothetical protein BHE74_00054765 [Ensete ventricosum]|uniref:Uncharacterized protein n=1 Tax=Ensete ventricosum TaxID=4639 RepID=A0A445MGC5_ENSVE|nr:hypothetical protein BHE74_00054765 [Ensete ventricosum]RZR73322.1 hypothetical protein BHM03_00022760 [Ensete ventricosum]